MLLGGKDETGGVMITKMNHGLRWLQPRQMRGMITTKTNVRYDYKHETLYSTITNTKHDVEWLKTWTIMWYAYKHETLYNMITNIKHDVEWLQTWTSLGTIVFSLKLLCLSFPTRISF